MGLEWHQVKFDEMDARSVMLVRGESSGCGVNPRRCYAARQVFEYTVF